jgi:hypothetical protein
MNSLLLLIVICLFPLTSKAANFEITPFNTVNQSPLLQIYALPHNNGSDIVSSGKVNIQVSQDLSSNYSHSINSSSREVIILDSEVNRTVFSARYGLFPHFESGIEIPYISQNGGFLDSFVINWHSTFGLPQGGRDIAPRNRLNYSYWKDGVQKLKTDHVASGIGDITLTGGYGLHESSDNAHHNRLALKGGVKLPTGDSSDMLGSGGADIVIQICGSMNNYRDWGSLGFFGSAGALAMSKGDVLHDQHKSFAGIGMLGFGWGPASWISFKVQLNGNTPTYKNSSLAEISKSSLLLIVGGALKFPGELLLDIGVSEDVAVATAPDVSFHLGLTKNF